MVMIFLRFFPIISSSMRIPNRRNRIQWTSRRLMNSRIHASAWCLTERAPDYTGLGRALKALDCHGSALFRRLRLTVGQPGTLILFWTWTVVAPFVCLLLGNMVRGTPGHLW